jgi:hypothetical protein
MAFNHKQAAKETGLFLLPLLVAGVPALIIYAIVNRWGDSGGVGIAIVVVFGMIAAAYYGTGRS